MDIWYTPERIAMYQEIGRRRMARYQRREARMKREEAREKLFGALKVAFGYLAATALFFAYLFAGALWAGI